MDTRFVVPRDIPARMYDFCDWLNADESLALPIAELVCRAHFFLAEIHPFADGNVHTARLLMNLLLIRKGYPIAHHP